jgi:hypothetical protein
MLLASRNLFLAAIFSRVYGKSPSPPVLKSRNSTSHVETRASPTQNLSLVNASDKRRRRSLARGGIVATIEAPLCWRAPSILLGEGLGPAGGRQGRVMHAGQCQRADIGRRQLTEGPTIGRAFFSNLSKDFWIVSSRPDLCRNIAEARCGPFRLQKCPRWRAACALVPAEHGHQLNAP